MYIIKPNWSFYHKEIQNMSLKKNTNDRVLRFTGSFFARLENHFIAGSTKVRRLPDWSRLTSKNGRHVVAFSAIIRDGMVIYYASYKMAHNNTAIKPHRSFPDHKRMNLTRHCGWIKIPEYFGEISLYDPYSTLRFHFCPWPLSWSWLFVKVCLIDINKKYMIYYIWYTSTRINR